MIQKFKPTSIERIPLHETIGHRNVRPHPRVQVITCELLLSEEFVANSAQYATNKAIKKFLWYASLEQMYLSYT